MKNNELGICPSCNRYINTLDKIVYADGKVDYTCPNCSMYLSSLCSDAVDIIMNNRYKKLVIKTKW